MAHLTAPRAVDPIKLIPSEPSNLAVGEKTRAMVTVSSLLISLTGGQFHPLAPRLLSCRRQ